MRALSTRQGGDFVSVAQGDGVFIRNQQFRFVSSFHPAGTNFLSADGSVTLIAETIDLQVYHALCTRAAGDVVGRL